MGQDGTAPAKDETGAGGARRAGATRREHCDVVIVGARPAGSAAAIALARAGRRVIAVDRAAFPADTLSTHLLFPGGVAELQRSGALQRVLATGVPPLLTMRLVRGGHDARCTFTAVDGIDYGLCCRRPPLDLAMVQTAREAGATVLERTRADDVLRRDGRAVGVACTTSAGERLEIHARLVVGADGRRSTTAEALGVGTPYRTDDNHRGVVFVYSDDPRPAGERPDEIAQWRVGDTLGMYFPTDHGGGLTMLVPPKEEIGDFRDDEHGTWRRKLDEIEALRARVAPTGDPQRQRLSAEHPAFFRVSSGPGWALVGDAGHFKHPVVAQGMRDALHYGRTLGEASAPLLDDPAALDRRLRAWEAERDRECLPFYYLGLRETRTGTAIPVQVAMWDDLASSSALATEVADMFSRTRPPAAVMTLPRKVRWMLKALRTPGAGVCAVARSVRDDLRFGRDLRRDLRAVAAGGRPRSRDRPAGPGGPRGPRGRRRHRRPRDAGPAPKGADPAAYSSGASGRTGPGAAHRPPLSR